MIIRANPDLFDAELDDEEEEEVWEEVTLKREDDEALWQEFETECVGVRSIQIKTKSKVLTAIK